MTAREKLIGMFSQRGIGEAVADEILRDHRAEVLQEAADTLEEIDPIEFALQSVDPITELRRMAEGKTDD